MELELSIAPLTSQDRSDFSCGDEELDRFIQRYAKQNQKKGLSATYVITTPNSDKVIAFVSVSAGSIERASLPSNHQRPLPAYPLPILRLSRMGVSITLKGKGLGAQLLKHVFHIALTQRAQSGCVGIVVDAKTNARSYYEQYGFMLMQGVEDDESNGTTPMFLDIRTVEQAAGAPK